MTQRPSCPCSFSSTSGSYSQPPGPRTSLSRPAPTRVYPDLCPGLPPLTPFGPSPRVTALPPPGRAPALGTCRASRPRPPPWDAPPIASAYANQAAPPPPLPARQEAPRRPAPAAPRPAPAAPRPRPAPCRASSRVSRSSRSFSRSRWTRAASAGAASPPLCARASSRRRTEGAANSSSKPGRALSPRRGCSGRVAAAPPPTGAARRLRGDGAAARQPRAARRARESSRMAGWGGRSRALPSPALPAPETPERPSGRRRRASARASGAVGSYRGSAGGNGRRGSAAFGSRGRALCWARSDWPALVGRAMGVGPGGNGAPPRAPGPCGCLWGGRRAREVAFGWGFLIRPDKKNKIKSPQAPKGLLG